MFIRGLSSGLSFIVYMSTGHMPCAVVGHSVSKLKGNISIEL